MNSAVNYTIESQDGHINKDFITNEIKQMSVGITETKIIDESWNGEQYYIKAEIVADPTDVVRRINQTLEKRQSDVVIDSLHVLLNNMQQNVEVKNAEIIKLNEQLQIQTSTNEQQELKVTELNQQLSSLRLQLSQYRQEEQQILSEIDRIKKNLQNITTKAVTNAKIGMNTAEVRSVCGNPRQIQTCSDYTWYNYGYLWLGFEEGVLVVGISVENYKGSCGMVYFTGGGTETRKNILRR